jgi:hypothetical protein
MPRRMPGRQGRSVPALYYWFPRPGENAQPDGPRFGGYFAPVSGVLPKRFFLTRVDLLSDKAGDAHRPPSR